VPTYDGIGHGTRICGAVNRRDELVLGMFELDLPVEHQFEKADGPEVSKQRPFLIQALRNGLLTLSTPRQFIEQSLVGLSFEEDVAVRFKNRQNGLHMVRPCDGCIEFGKSGRLVHGGSPLLFPRRDGLHHYACLSRPMIFRPLGPTLSPSSTREDAEL
jgi:hypothetical protein